MDFTLQNLGLTTPLLKALAITKLIYNTSYGVLHLKKLK